MQLSKTSVPLLLLLSVLVLNSKFISIAFASEIEAEALVVKADTTIMSSFNNVLEAEKAGANVSDLIERLLLAISAIDEAKHSLAKGNIDETIGRANYAISVADEVSRKASTLRVEALEKRDEEYRANVFFAILGIALFLFVMNVLWQLAKKACNRRILNLQPETTENV